MAAIRPDRYFVTKSATAKDGNNTANLYAPGYKYTEKRGGTN